MAVTAAQADGWVRAAYQPWAEPADQPAVVALIGEGQPEQIQGGIVHRSQGELLKDSRRRSPAGPSSIRGQRSVTDGSLGGGGQALHQFITYKEGQRILFIDHSGNMRKALLVALLAFTSQPALAVSELTKMAATAYWKAACDVYYGQVPRSQGGAAAEKYMRQLGIDPAAGYRDKEAIKMAKWLDRRAGTNCFK